MNIGQASKLTGLSNKMIRHYESIGLIKPQSRTEAGYRNFAEYDIQQLKFIFQARSLGFSLDQVAQLLLLWKQEDRASINVSELVKQHIVQLNQKIEVMLQMRSTLEKLVDSCPASDNPNCPILAALSLPTIK
jgi:MerR family copper efflux transcriptional regulator